MRAGFALARVVRRFTLRRVRFVAVDDAFRFLAVRFVVALARRLTGARRTPAT